MESKIEYHKISKKLPEEDELVLLYYINGKKEIVFRDFGYLDSLSLKWFSILKDKYYRIEKFNRWAYFPYPTE